MNLKKNEIVFIFSNQLIIFCIAFLAILFFQVKTVKAECTYGYSDGKDDNYCYKIQKYPAADSSCSAENAVMPSACKWQGAVCNCCCSQPTSAKPAKMNDSLPQWKNPLDNLQVDIPGLVYSSLDKVKASCKEENGKKVCNFPWIGEYIAGVYKYAIGIVGILAAVVLMIGGVMWIIAGGSATMIGEAKAWIGASLTGLIIALTSYLILYQVNPALVGFNGLNITMVEKIKELVSNRTGGTAEQYKNMPCPSASELAAGVQIYTTGYYHPPYGTDRKSLCMIHMSCSCPESVGINNQENCDDIFPNNKNYRPCNYIPPNIPYCNKTASPGNPSPHLGNPTTVAAPNCINFGTKLCIKGKNYIAEDRGGDIQGKRIDIWSGESIDTANSNSGLATMTIGACN